MMTAYELAVDPFTGTGALPTGFGTPASDTSPQVCRVPPRRVIPIVFLPGIMGSNLKITEPARVDALRRDVKDTGSDIAWRPDDIGVTNVVTLSRLTPAERQLLLDPEKTAVDVYDPRTLRSTSEGDARNRNVSLAPGFYSPLLVADRPVTARSKTTEQKARMRGWGEVFFGSYGSLLQRVESQMQQFFRNGQLEPEWTDVVGVDPARWQLDKSTLQKALTVDELKAITKDTFFPVHAIGYNWLVDNRVNASLVATKILAIIESYRSGPGRKYDCPGVIVVTHSMGGLLGRALVHPDMGCLKDQVIGMVHGVQPATGAAAGYRRMRAGFEDDGLAHGPASSVAAKVSGNHGDEVTAVLANSVGGLQLLPSKAYGDGWLRVRFKGKELLRLPKNGDPYEEIYKLSGKWYGLVSNESWIDPAHLSPDSGKGTIKSLHKRLEAARSFHDTLGSTYHPVTYAHYGADQKHPAFGNITWTISPDFDQINGWQDWRELGDDKQGTVVFGNVRPKGVIYDGALSEFGPNFSASIGPPDEAGDLTVPMRSADHALREGRCKAVFRQTGYDHQGSYENDSVLAATLFSILRIAQTVQLP